MKIYRPKLIPEFYKDESGKGYRILWTLRYCDGSIVNENSHREAASHLLDQAKLYMDIRARRSYMEVAK